MEKSSCGGRCIASNASKYVQEESKGPIFRKLGPLSTPLHIVEISRLVWYIEFNDTFGVQDVVRGELESTNLVEWKFTQLTHGFCQCFQAANPSKRTRCWARV